MEVCITLIFVSHYSVINTKENTSKRINDKKKNDLASPKTKKKSINSKFSFEEKKKNFEIAQLFALFSFGYRRVESESIISFG